MNNEQGFVTPITLIISLLLVSTAFFQIQQYSMEKKFFKEQEEIFTIEALLQIGTVDLLSLLSNVNAGENLVGQFNYDKGAVHYTISPREGNRFVIFLEPVTNDGRKRRVIVHYDLNTSKLLRWIET